MIVSALEAHYGRPSPPLTSAVGLIIYENIGYLVDDQRREAAFVALRDQIGLRPIDLLSASNERLLKITQLGGIHPEMRAQRLQEIAQIVLNDFAGDLDSVLRLPFKQAIKELKKFPSIGEPGAEKILLFTKTYPVLALDSNGLRVLLRLGYGTEGKNYSASYRSAREALSDQLGNDCDFLIRAHLLLRRHGKELCKTTMPRCDNCSVRQNCRYNESTHHSDGQRL